MSVVHDLTLSFEGGFSLSIPHWTISDRGITALSGASGAGKTTVFRALIGLIPCPTLKWRFADVDLARLPVGARHLGVVFQSLELFPHLTAQENVLFAAEARQLDQGEALRRWQDLAQDLSLLTCADRPARVLSGGEAQRVALARAVISRPRFLFLDEPFSSLDADLRSEARNLVRELIQKWEIPTLLITHDSDDLKALASCVVTLHNGRLHS